MAEPPRHGPDAPDPDAGPEPSFGRPTYGRPTYEPPPWQGAPAQPPYAPNPYPPGSYAQPPYAQPPNPQQPYGQQPYGQQPYGQQPYPQPPYAQPPYVPFQPTRPATDPGSVIGIIGLVLSCLGALLTFIAIPGVILSIVAFVTSRNAGYRNLFALIGIGVGALVLLVGTAWLVATIVTAART